MSAADTDAPAERRLRPDPQVLRQHVKKVGNELYGLSRQELAKRIAEPLLDSVEELRLVWAALRRMALAPSGSGVKAKLNQERELKQAVDGLKRIIESLSLSNERAVTLIDEQCGTLEQLDTLDQEGEIADLLRTLTGGLREAAGEMQGGIARSRAEITASEHVIDAVGGELEEAHQQTMEDQLTRLLSRVAFEERLEELASHSPEETGRWCVAIASIDSFDALVHQHGDLVGDALVFRVAELIESRCAPFPGALVARYDDEQFGILLPHCPLRHAYRLATDICDTVGHTQWECKAVDPPTVITASVRIGLAEHRDGEPAEALLERAYACLQQAVCTRRDTVVVEG